MRSALFAVALFAVVSGCSGASTAPTPSKSASPVAVATTPSDASWHCGGELEPPSGYQQETTIFSKTRTDVQGAIDAATRRLEGKICPSGEDCAFVRARIKTWKTGSDGQNVCAMAVVQNSDLEEFHRMGETIKELDAKLADLFGTLLAEVCRERCVVLLDPFDDDGAPGGVRATWLKHHVEAQLIGRFKGASLAKMPRGWAGDRMPDGVDLVVRGFMIPRREGQFPIIEANFRAEFKDGRERPTGPVTFPQFAAPGLAPRAGPTIDASSGGASIHIDSGHDGSLCAGDRTQVWFRSDRPVYVRAIDLFGDAEALTVYPVGGPGQVQPNTSVPLGGRDDLVAVPAPGHDYERFVVVIADDPADLDWLEGLNKGQCRLSKDKARALADNVGLPPKVRVVSTGYRLLDDADCPKVDPMLRTRMADALKSVPICP